MHHPGGSRPLSEPHDRDALSEWLRQYGPLLIVEMIEEPYK